MSPETVQVAIEIADPRVKLRDGLGPVRTWVAVGTFSLGPRGPVLVGYEVRQVPIVRDGTKAAMRWSEVENVASVREAMERHAGEWPTEGEFLPSGIPEWVLRETSATNLMNEMRQRVTTRRNRAGKRVGDVFPEHVEHWRAGTPTERLFMIKPETEIPAPSEAERRMFGEQSERTAATAAELTTLRRLAALDRAYADGLNRAEAAKRLGVSEGTVKAALAWARDVPARGGLVFETGGHGRRGGAMTPYGWRLLAAAENELAPNNSGETTTKKG